MPNTETLVIKHSKAGTVITIFIVAVVGIGIGLDALALGEIKPGRHVVGLAITGLIILYLMFLLTKSTVLITCTGNGIVLPVYNGTIPWSKVQEIKIGMIERRVFSHSVHSREKREKEAVYVLLDETISLPVTVTRNLTAHVRNPHLFAFSTDGVGMPPEKVVEILNQRLEAARQ